MRHLEQIDGVWQVIITLFLICLYGFYKNRKLIFKKSTVYSECVAGYQYLVQEIKDMRLHSDGHRVHANIMTWYYHYQGRVQSGFLETMKSGLSRKFVQKQFILQPKAK